MILKNEKQILTERALRRANSGLYFLEKVLQDMHGGTDGVYSRSLYILFAYNFELILSALFILASSKTTRDDIIKELMAASKQHDFANLFSRIPVSSRLGINKVVKDESNGFTEYHVELGNGHKIVVQDLVDVRYDFKKDSLRSINPNEGEDMKATITAFLEIIKKILETANLV